MDALRIIVVEDDPLLGMLLADMLQSMGHEVCAAALTEDAAVTAAARYRPDLIILDARLGEGSGLSALDEILRDAFVPHLFMTGNLAKLRMMRPDSTILQKPFGEAELAEGITRAMNAVVA